MHLEITTYSVIQFFIWLTISVAIISMISYMYLNKTKNEDANESFTKDCKENLKSGDFKEGVENSHCKEPHNLVGLNTSEFLEHLDNNSITNISQK